MQTSGVSVDSAEASGTAVISFQREPWHESSITIDMRNCKALKLAQIEPSRDVVDPNHAVSGSVTCSREWRKSHWDMLMSAVRVWFTDDLQTQSDHRRNVDATDLALVFEKIDQIYFGGQLWGGVCQSQNSLTIAINMGDDGLCAMAATGCVQEIEKVTGEIIMINASLVQTVWQQPERPPQGHFWSSGVSCGTALECLMHTFAHEIMHWIRARYAHDKHVAAESVNHGHDFWFLRTSYQLFGHTQSWETWPFEMSPGQYQVGNSPGPYRSNPDLQRWKILQKLTLVPELRNHCGMVDDGTDDVVVVEVIRAPSWSNEYTGPWQVQVKRQDTNVEQEVDIIKLLL